jgi:Skp family chaperone for outer membrane proteins
MRLFKSADEKEQAAQVEAEFRQIVGLLASEPERAHQVVATLDSDKLDTLSAAFKRLEA